METETGFSGASAPSFSEGSFSPGTSADFESFSGAVSSENVFSETTPFSASIGSVPEMSPFQSKDIFSNPDGFWTTLAKADFAPSFEAMGFETQMPISVETPVSLSSEAGLGSFEELMAQTGDVKPEVGVLDNEITMVPGEWVVLAENKNFAAFEVENTIGETESLMQEKLVEEVLSSEPDLMLNKAEGDEEPVTQETMELSEKVVKLLTETGVYSEQEARLRVEEISGAKIKEQVTADAEVEAQEEVKVKEEPLDVKEEVKTPVELEAQEDEEPPVEDEIRRKRGFDFDEEAQKNRKKEAKGKIKDIFAQAERTGKDRVSTLELAASMPEKDELKSQVLWEAERESAPDGSFKDSVTMIAAIGDTSVSKENEDNLEEAVDLIFDLNRPVRVIENETRNVSKKEVDKVLRYTDLRANPDVFSSN